MIRNLWALCLVAALGLSAPLVVGCGGDGGGTVQPAKPEPTPAASGPVAEPPSTDEK